MRKGVQNSAKEGWGKTRLQYEGWANSCRKRESGTGKGVGEILASRKSFDESKTTTKNRGMGGGIGKLKGREYPKRFPSQLAAIEF